MNIVATRLFNPKHIGQIRPAVGVLNRSKGSSLPCERAVLGQESAERATSWSTVQPDHNLLFCFRLSGREEPEEKLASLVGVIRDGQKSSVRLADIEGDLGKASTVHGKRLCLIRRKEAGSTPLNLRMCEWLVCHALLNNWLLCVSKDTKLVRRACREGCRKVREASS
jgi:hypothetical protein